MTTSLVKREEAPAWVRLGLYKLETRSSARAFLALSGLLGAIGVAAGAMVNPIYYVAVGFWLAVPWYARAIRWMDEHGAWHDD
jgi:hypothetical protein